ncbi:MAG: M14 family metallopeptidase [Clostridia bacterium]
MEYLKFSSKGTDVELIQLALSRAGYYPGNIDGIFGEKTKSALESFQRENALTSDGIVGVLTFSRLRPYLVGYVTHSVTRNDTFFALSQKYATNIEAIRVANPNVSTNSLGLGEKIIVPLGFTVVPTNVHYTYKLTTLIVEGLAARYPFLRTGSLGQSAMGNELFYLKLGAGTKSVFYNASHHANEWITTPLVLRFAEELCMSYAFSTRLCYNTFAVDILNSSKLFIAPLVNPDGIDLVNGAIPELNMYYDRAKKIAEAYPEISFPSGWKANIEGTDLNLNYPAEWDKAKHIKYELGFTSPAPRDFVGKSPLSAPESRAVYKFTITHDFELTISYHTQGEEIYWQFLNYAVDGAYETAKRFSEVSGYSLSCVAYNSSFAGYKDWFIEKYRKRGFTIEAGHGTNPLPISDFPDIYSENVKIMCEGLKL